MKMEEPRRSKGLRSLLALATIGIMADTTSAMYRDEPRKQPELPSTLNKPQKSKRSKRNKLAKQSRKQNRK